MAGGAKGLVQQPRQAIARLELVCQNRQESRQAGAMLITDYNLEVILELDVSGKRLPLLTPFSVADECVLTLGGPILVQRRGC